MMLDIKDYDPTTDRGRRDIIAATVEKLNQQGGSCVSLDSLDCEYSRGGRHCAVGWWLPEDHEAQTFFGGIRELCKQYPDIKERLGCQDAGTLSFWSELQGLHDRPSSWQGPTLRPDAVSEVIKGLEMANLLEQSP